MSAKYVGFTSLTLVWSESQSGTWNMYYTLKNSSNCGRLKVTAVQSISLQTGLNSSLNKQWSQHLVKTFLIVNLFQFFTTQEFNSTLKNLSNWGLLKLAAVRSSTSSLQTGLNSSLHKHPFLSRLVLLLLLLFRPTNDWQLNSAVYYSVCSWIMNRLDQLSKVVEIR